MGGGGRGALVSRGGVGIVVVVGVGANQIGRREGRGVIDVAVGEGPKNSNHEFRGGRGGRATGRGSGGNPGHEGPMTAGGGNPVVR
ncbi:hypothetical protein TIFTF001_007276 [Ficus carica]|uniref:Uncharacterized protein n=1 Tax=Ficus carica TaxID=3494 RepID=A0AA88AD27_FICCA|nr:hypothetical protein TIFTF001_007276 [Ficus carica]